MINNSKHNNGTILMHGDCLERMKEIPDGSVDAIIADPPYGTTACKWDSIIPLEPMWTELERVIRPNGMIVMTASQPFTTKLIYSNIGSYSHQWVWDKKTTPNPFLCKKMPIKSTEDIIVFCFNYNTHDIRRKYFKKLYESIGLTKKQIINKTNQGLDHCFRFNSKQFDIPTLANYELITELFSLSSLDFYIDYHELSKYRRVYNPQMTTRGEPVKKGFKGVVSKNSFMGAVEMDTLAFNNTYYPTTVLEIKRGGDTRLHPTQKPVALMEYLIKTYTNEGETVLDFTAGSFTTGVAAINTNRKFIGIEMDEKYFAIGDERINEAVERMK